MDITLYAICKNEEENIDKFVENAKKFSRIVVVDTGSTDNTINLLREKGFAVYEYQMEEFDFSKARNYALSLVETDWAFSLDFNESVDEFFPAGLDVISTEFTKFNHLRFDQVGDEEPRQSNEVHTRFHRTKSYQWRNAVHEIPFFVPTEEYPEEVSVDTTIKITKQIENSVAKELFYLDICEREYRKDPTNWYYLWFIFSHYFKIQDLHKALEYGQEFLNISQSYFNSFRVEVFIKCSMIFFQLQEYQKAANYAFHAVSEAMNMGQEQLSKASSYLFEISKRLNNPNLIVFASSFSEHTLRLPERHKAIDSLFLTNLDDVPATAWSGHRRFAEWLVQQVRPEVTVDLGVDYGFSTLCFAMPRIGQVYGIDNFVGDDYVGQHTNHQYEFIMMKREKLHLQDILTIIKGDFNEIAETWNQKIDILHIDGSHKYEDVKRDYETWSKFVNENGVILLHDTCVENLDGTEYGVKKFFDEIDLPKFNFTHCYGLGVISKNQNLINQIRNTFQ